MGEENKESILMVVLACPKCNSSWNMEKYWYDIWMEKKKVNKKYKGIRCKYCGAYDSVVLLEGENKDG